MRQATAPGVDDLSGSAARIDRSEWERAESAKPGELRFVLPLHQRIHHRTCTHQSRTDGCHAYAVFRNFCANGIGIADHRELAGGVRSKMRQGNKTTDGRDVDDAD